MVIIWDKQRDSNNLILCVDALEPIEEPIEEPVEELSIDSDEELIEEVKTATINPAYKGFGS
jgi:hypothetical protein